MGFDPAKAGLNNTKLIVQRAYSQNSRKQKSSYEQRSARLVYPYEISPNDLSNNGYILAVIDNLFNDGETRHLKIMINDEAYKDQKLYDQKNPTKNEGNFNGAYIDSKMAAKIEFKATNVEDRKKIIGLEQAVFHTGKIEKINGVEYIPVSARRIVNCKYLNKAEYGPITATAYFDDENRVYKIGSLDLWETKPVTFYDKDNLEKVKEYLNMVSEETIRYNNKEDDVNMLPRAGFRFIASKVVYTTDPATQEKVVDKRIIFDSTDSFTAARDEDTEKTRPIRYEELEALMNGYKAYVFDGYSENDASLIEVLNNTPDITYKEGENFHELGKIEKEDVLIELITFKTYMPAPMQMKHFSFDTEKKGVEYNPLFKMTRRPFYNSILGSEAKLGRNLAVLGFIKISKDKINEETMTKSVQSFVTSAHFGDFAGNILTYLRNAEDDKKYFVVEKIRAMVRTEEDRKREEQRNEERKLKEGNANTLSSADSGLSAPSNLSLQGSSQEQDKHEEENLFSEESTEKTQVVESVEQTKAPEPVSSIIDEDDDIPF